VRNAKNILNGEQETETQIDTSFFVVSSPNIMQKYESPPEKQLIGDFHIVKDSGLWSWRLPVEKITRLHLAGGGWGERQGERVRMKIHRKLAP
jgi:hypothetical protein